MITDKLKQTLENDTKFLTLSLAITLQKKCMDEFMRLGVSPQTLSFLVVGMTRLAAEIAEGHDYVNTQEKFKSITEQLKDIAGENDE